MEYILSICMMVKNEELHLKRCLESIKPILERNDVELIIVDTGSEDATVEIAKEYTKKIHFKKWFNDFSGMRNVTISYAKGKWILILDADEAIENADVFDSFIDDELNNKKINTYFLKVNNYTNLNNLDSFARMVSPRIFKNDGTFKYKGTVHNQPIYKIPIKNTDILIGHYGYITSSKKIMDEKFLRTSTLLIEELEKEPNNIYYLLQLATSYNMHGDIKDSYKVSKKTYDLIMSYEKKNQISGYAIFSIHISNCIALEKYNETIEVCKKALELKEDYIDAYFSLVYSYEKLGETEVAKEYALKYLDLCDEFYKLDISKDDAIIIYRNDNSTIKKVKIFLSGYYLTRSNYKKACIYLEDLEIDINILKIYIKAYVELKDYILIKELYEKVKDKKELKRKFFQIIEEKIKKMDEEERNIIRNLFEDIKGDYSSYCKFTMIPENDNELRLKSAIELYKIMDKSNPNFYYAEVISFICEKRDLSLNIFNLFNRSNIFYYINYFYNNKYNEVYLELYEWVKIVEINQPTLKNQFTLVYILEAIIQRLILEYKSTGIDDKIKTNKDLFEKYLDAGLRLVPKIYSTEGISLKYDYITDQESKFMVLMYLYNENLNKENFKSAFKYYKLAAETYPEMADFLSRYLEIE